MLDPNIVGISAEEKETGGKKTGMLAIRFDVVRKLTDHSEIIRAGSRPIPATVEIDGLPMPTDVEEGWPEAHASEPVDGKRQHDPVCGGVSLGTGTDDGTLGAVLWHRPTRQAVALSNWHILANDPDSKVVFQPGPGDSTGKLDALGTLLDEDLGSDLDAAICTIHGRGVRAELAGLGVAVTAAAAPAAGMRVAKVGKETGITFGRVVALHKNFSYRVFGRAARHEIEACVIAPDPDRAAPRALSKHGDSGSCWMLVGEDGQTTGTMVGLHVAGDSGRKLAYACHADKVFERFQLEPLGARGSVAVAAAADLPDPHLVTARDGAFLRSGPGREFPDKALLAYGAPVNVAARYGEWLAIDLQGDGRLDGFTHRSLLRPTDSG